MLPGTFGIYTEAPYIKHNNSKLFLKEHKLQRYTAFTYSTFNFLLVVVAPSPHIP